MKLRALSHYGNDVNTRYGDCILLYDTFTLVVYDCEHSKHAQIDLKKFLPFSMVCSVGLGWSVVIFSRQLLSAVPVPSYAWLLSGGISYTLGSVLYLIGKRKKHMHSVFHLFVVLGSVLHFVSVLICFTQ